MKNIIKKQGKEKKSYEKDEKSFKSYLNRDYGVGDGGTGVCRGRDRDYYY